MIRRIFTWRRLGYAAAGLLVLYTLLGFVGVPLAIHYLVLPRINNRLNGRMDLGKARFNPFTMRLFLGGIDIRDVDANTVLAAEQFVIDAQWSTIWRKGVILKEFSLTKPFAHVGITTGGRFRMLSLFKLDEATHGPAPTPTPKEPSESLRLAIARIAIVGGSLLITDDSLAQPFRHHIGPMDMAMDDFDTLPTNRNPHKFAAVSQTGEKLEWEGWFHLNPLSTEGQLTISGITAQQYDPYSQTFANFRVKSGRISVTAGYRIDLSSLPVSVGGSIKSYVIEDAQLTPIDSDEPFLHVGQLAIRGATWNLVERSAQIEAIELRDGMTLAHRLADGTLNWETYFKTGPAEPGSTTATPASATAATDAAGRVDPADPWEALLAAVSGAGGPWNVTIGGISVDGHTIRWRDDATPRSVDATLLAEHLAIGEIRSDDGYRLPIKASLKLNDTPLTLEGEVIPMPATMNFTVDVDGLALSPLDPYVEAHAMRARFRDGRLFVKGDVVAKVVDDQPPLVSFRGDVRLDDFDMAEAIDSDPILKWRSFGLTQLRMDSQPLAITIGAVHLDQPLVAYTITEQGQPAINALLVQAPPAEDSPTTAAAMPDAASSAPMPMQSIGQISIAGGQMAFLDRSHDPHVSLKIAELEGKISSLSSDPQASASIEMRARLQDTANATIAGQINPLLVDQFMNVRVTLDTLPMQTFEAFSRQYLGYMIDRGMLTFEFPLKIEQQKLEGEIRVVLDKFHLGQRVESPEATNLPVGLALDLLRDISDKIRINVPIRGDMRDPQFSYGHLIVQAIFNTMGNIVASPFKFIASTLGAGDVDLSRVDFDAGRTELLPDTLKKLELLTTAMKERPALKLQIRGSIDRGADLVALKKARLMQAIRSAMAQRMPADDPRRTTPEAIVVLDEDYRLIVAERYKALQSGEVVADAGGVAVELPRTGPPGPPRRVMRGGRMQTVPPPPGARHRPTPPPDVVPTTPDGQPIEGVVAFGQMEQTVLDAIGVSMEELTALGDTRAAAVREHLVGVAGLAAERLSIVPTPQPTSDTKAGVEFILQ